MRTHISFYAILILLIPGIFFILLFASCKKAAVPSQIYGTYSGTSTNYGLVHGANNQDTFITDSFVIASAGPSSGDTVTILETHFNVTMTGIVSSNNDTLYIPAQPVVYAGHSCIFTGNPGTISGSGLQISISESINNVNAGLLAFNGSD